MIMLSLHSAEGL